MNQSLPPPVVVVGGFLTRNSTSYWGDIQQHFPDRQIIIAPVGACSSLHDRACEIYYSLKGGRVDYGAEHAKDHKHGQYGRKYSKGLYPQWSTSNPIHFVTHSLGGPTVTKLITLLRSRFFGDDSHPDMVRSLFAVAAPFKGTPTVYLLGASYTGSHLLRTFSLGNFLAKYIHISSFLSPLFSYDPEAWDFQPDSRNLGVFALPHHPGEDDDEVEEEKKSWSWSSLKQSVHTLWTQLRTSDWADSADSGSYDATFHAADARDRAGESVLNANTFYCSLMGTITTKEADSNHHRPDREFRSDIFLYILAKMVGSFSYNVQPAPEFLFASMSMPQVAAAVAEAAMVCSHPVAQARRLSVQTSLLPTTSKPLLSAASSSASSSGSSGWHSPTDSFRLSEDSFTPPPVAPATAPALSLSIPPFGSLSPMAMTSSTPTRRRPGHTRDSSLTDWYAHWAADWSTVQYPVPGAWDTRDAETAVPEASVPAPAIEEAEVDVEAEVDAVPRQLRDDLWENDGVVAVYSQTHPSECSDAHCKHHGDLSFETMNKTAPSIGTLDNGIWHVFKSWGMSHNCLVGGLARYESRRNAVWIKISEAMHDLDSCQGDGLRKNDTIMK